MALELTPLPSTAGPARISNDLVPYARHDPILCSMPGLFRSVDDKFRAENAVSLRLKTVHGKLTVELHNSCVLNGLDLAVLQALVALAAAGNTLDASDQEELDETERVLVDALDAPGAEVPEVIQAAGTPAAPVTGDVQHIEFSNTALLELIGWPVCGENRALVQDCLKRLATCVLIVYPTATPKDWQRFHLLSSINTRIQSDKWSRTHVALNPRLSQIVLGTEARHTRIALDETRKLGKDQAARILHQRLCSWINEGAVRPVSFSTLVEYLYPDDLAGRTLDKLNPKVAKQPAEKTKIQRLQEVQKAMNVLASLQGWDVYLASDAPFLPEQGLTDGERVEAKRKHEQYCLAARRTAAANVMDTVIHVRRGQAFE